MVLNSRNGHCKSNRYRKQRPKGLPSDYSKENSKIVLYCIYERTTHVPWKSCWPGSGNGPAFHPQWMQLWSHYSKIQIAAGSRSQSHLQGICNCHFHSLHKTWCFNKDFRSFLKQQPAFILQMSMAYWVRASLPESVEASRNQQGRLSSEEAPYGEAWRSQKPKRKVPGRNLYLRQGNSQAWQQTLTSKVGWVICKGECHDSLDKVHLSL